MGINKENYEAYFLDYQEGNLNTEQVAELMVFLEVYPDLKDELETFELMKVIPDNDIRIENKNFLKKKSYIPTQNIGNSNYEEWLVAYIEGDLTLEDTNEFKDFLEKNPTARLELNIFRKTVLKPGPVEFENKQSLKKSGIFLLYSRQIVYTVSIAASILLFFGLYFIGDIKTNSRVAEAEMNIKLQPLQITKLNTGSTAFHEIPSPKISEISYGIIEPNLESKAKKSDNISRLAAIRQNSFVQIEDTDVYYISNKYDVTYMLNESESSTINNFEKKSFIGRFISSTVSKLVPAGNSPNKSFLEYSVEGYNLLADREVEVEKQYDNDGNVVAYIKTGPVTIKTIWLTSSKLYISIIINS